MNDPCRSPIDFSYVFENSSGFRKQHENWQSALGSRLKATATAKATHDTDCTDVTDHTEVSSE